MVETVSIKWHFIFSHKLWQHIIKMSKTTLSAIKVQWLCQHHNYATWLALTQDTYEAGTVISTGVRKLLEHIIKVGFLRMEIKRLKWKQQWVIFLHLKLFVVNLSWDELADVLAVESKFGASWAHWKEEKITFNDSNITWSLV